VDEDKEDGEFSGSDEESPPITKSKKQMTSLKDKFPLRSSNLDLSKLPVLDNRELS
jgi:hypothetical protein